MTHNPQTCKSCQYNLKRNPNYDPVELGKRSMMAAELQRFPTGITMEWRAKQIGFDQDPPKPWGGIA